MHINKGTHLKWIYFILIAVVLTCIEAALCISLDQEILLYTQRPYNLTNNTTLVAEDVDPHAGVVWLKLYSRNQTLKSALVGVGDRFIYNDTNLTVSKIYAGGDRDLVELNADNGRNHSYNNSNRKINNNRSLIISTEKHSQLNLTEIEISSTNASKRSSTSMKSPGMGVWIVLLVALVRRLIKAI
jgi:hypothetical protein